MSLHIGNTAGVQIAVVNLSCFYAIFNFYFRRDPEERRTCQQSLELLNSPSRLSYTSMIRSLVMRK